MKEIDKGSDVQLHCFNCNSWKTKTEHAFAQVVTTDAVSGYVCDDCWHAAQVLTEHDVRRYFAMKLEVQLLDEIISVRWNGVS